MEQEQLTEAILSVGASPLANEEGERLAIHWINNSSAFPEMNWAVLGAEVPFYIHLGGKFYIIGVMDAIFRDDVGTILGEWKTRRSPKYKKDGSAYEGDNEDGWLDDISNGPQLAIYALAGAEGVFLPFENLNEDMKLGVVTPRILVRAAIKSIPPQVWPNNWQKGLFHFYPAAIDATRAALTVKCRQILQARHLGLTPWQLVGDQCVNKYRHVCGLRETVCKTHQHPAMRPLGSPMEVRTSDPRKKVYEALKLDPDDREIVMLSASGYGTYSQCMEKGRVQYEAETGQVDEDSFELETGSVFHAAMAAFYGSRVSNQLPSGADFA